MFGMERPTQGEARRPTKSDKARHVGPPSAVCSSSPTFGIERPTQGEARRPTKSDKARHVGPPSAVYSSG